MKIKLLIALFALTYSFAYSQKGSVIIECYSCEDLKQTDCETCTGGTKKMFSGILIKGKQRALIDSPFEIEFKGSNVVLTDWQGERVSINRRDTKFSSNKALKEFIAECNCSGGASGGEAGSVDWDNIDNIPADIADGDDNTTYGFTQFQDTILRITPSDGSPVVDLNLCDFVDDCFDNGGGDTDVSLFEMNAGGDSLCIEENGTRICESIDNIITLQDTSAVDYDAGTLTLTETDGDATVIDICRLVDSCETVTTLSIQSVVFSGDSLAYEVSYIDEESEINTDTFYVPLMTKLCPIADAVRDTFIIEENCCPAAYDLSYNDIFPAGEIIEYHLISQPDSGFVFLNSNGTFLYTPYDTLNQKDSFQYVVRNPCCCENIDTAWVCITPPIAAPACDNCTLGRFANTANIVFQSTNSAYNHDFTVSFSASSNPINSVVMVKDLNGNIIANLNPTIGTITPMSAVLPGNYVINIDFSAAPLNQSATTTYIIEIVTSFSDGLSSSMEKLIQITNNLVGGAQIYTNLTTNGTNFQHIPTNQPCTNTILIAHRNNQTPNRVSNPDIFWSVQPTGGAVFDSGSITPTVQSGGIDIVLTNSVLPPVLSSVYDWNTQSTYTTVVDNNFLTGYPIGTQFTLRSMGQTELINNCN